MKNGDRFSERDHCVGVYAFSGADIVDDEHTVVGCLRTHKASHKFLMIDKSGIGKWNGRGRVGIAKRVKFLFRLNGTIEGVG